MTKCIGRLLLVCAGQATVTLNGTALAQDAASGWSMPTTSQVVLNGAACGALRIPGATIKLDFPCDTVLR